MEFDTISTNIKKKLSKYFKPFTKKPLRVKSGKRLCVELEGNFLHIDLSLFISSKDFNIELKYLARDCIDFVVNILTYDEKKYIKRIEVRKDKEVLYVTYFESYRTLIK
jgi:hypothetical protein